MQGAARTGDIERRVELDVFAWIPTQEVGNPVAWLPGGARLWGEAAAGLRFAGDGYREPADSPEEMALRTSRMHQRLVFGVDGAGRIKVIEQELKVGETRVLAGHSDALGCDRGPGFADQAEHRRHLGLEERLGRSKARVATGPGRDRFWVRLAARGKDPALGLALAVGASRTRSRRLTRVGRRVGLALTPACTWDLRLLLELGGHEKRVRVLGGGSMRWYPSYAAWVRVVDDAEPDRAPPPRRMLFVDAWRRPWQGLALPMARPVGLRS